LEAFQKELGERTAAKGLGSNRKKGTGINYARETYAKVRTRFGKLAQSTGISLEGIQVHHTFDELAKNPAQALETTNLSFQQGHAGSKGSAHNFAHEVNKAHAAGVKNPGQHVKTTMAAEGVQPRVPEFSPAPHVPHAPHAPKVPKGKKIGGWIGLAIGVGISGYVLLETGDVYAAGQAVNPAANTTETLVHGEVNAENVAWSAAQDIYYYTPVGTVHSVVFGLLGPQGDNYYDQKLADKAIKEGRNPFCAQCHGPGGALDPNNEWNRRATSGTALQPGPLTEADRKVLSDWLTPAAK
jgi:hypothetical protein